MVAGACRLGMSTALTYKIRTDDFSEEERIIRHGLNDYAKDTINIERGFMGVLAYDGDKMIGGLTSSVVGITLGIKLLWVDKDFRGKSVGKNLLAKLEQHGKESGCTQSFVDTLTYQAPEFYIKQGYTEIARITNYYDGYDRIFYRKELS